MRARSHVEREQQRRDVVFDRAQRQAGGVADFLVRAAREHEFEDLKVAREYQQPGVPMVVLETALPIKFAAAIVEALGREPDRPARFEGIEALPKRVSRMAADASAIKAYIAQHCP